MIRFASWRGASIGVFFFLAFAQPSRAQFGYGGAATIEGDYLRGLGVAAWGMGQYNLNTAQADSILTDTFIRWNDYLADVAKKQTREYVGRILADANKRKEFYKQRRQLILDSPESLDVLNGNALNRVLEELLNIDLGGSAARTGHFAVQVPVDAIRQTPFKVGEKGKEFSMDRLLLKGKRVWAVALQDDQFDIVKKQYAKALDKALEQAIDGRMQIPTIDKLDDKADDLFVKLNEVFPPSDDIRYIEAKQKLAELKSNVELLKITQIERAIGEIDQYSGTTVQDLGRFMMSHGLRFGAAKSPEEKARYPALYAALREQLDKLKTPEGVSIK
jgi:hypothetical protein